MDGKPQIKHRDSKYNNIYRERKSWATLPSTERYFLKLPLHVFHTCKQQNSCYPQIMSGCPFTPTYSYSALLPTFNRNPQVISPLPCRHRLCPRKHQLLQNAGFIFPVPSNTYSFIPERGLCFVKRWLGRFRLPHLRRFPLQVLICQHQRHPPVQSMPQWSHNKKQKSFKRSYWFPRRPKAINTMFFCKEQS